MERRTGRFSIAREASTMLGSNIAHLILEFLTLAVLSRSVPIEGVGAYFVVLTVVGMYRVPFNAFIDAMRKYGSEEGARVNELYGFVLAATGVGSVLFYGVLTAGSGIVLSIFGASPHLATSATVLFFGSVVFGATTELLAVDGYLGRESFLHTGRFLLIFLVFWWMADVLTPEMAVYLRAVVSVVISLIIAVFRGGTIPKLPSRATVTDVAGYSYWHVPSKILSKIRKRLPELVIGAAFGTQPVALYRAGEKISLIAGYTIFSLSRPFFVRSSWLDSRDEMEFGILQSVMRIAPVVPAFLFGFVLLFGDMMLVTLYTAEYAAGWGMLVVMVAIRVLYAYKNPLKESLLGVGATKEVFRVRLAATAVAVVLYPVSALFGTPIIVAVGRLVVNGVLVKGYQLMSVRVFGDSISLVGWLRQVTVWVVISAGVSLCLSAVWMFGPVWVWLALPGVLIVTIGLGAVVHRWVREDLEKGWELIVALRTVDEDD